MLLKRFAPSFALALALTVLFIIANRAAPVLAAPAVTFTVINTNDAGAGSLRWAINQANGSYWRQVLSRLAKVRARKPMSSTRLTKSSRDAV